MITINIIGAGNLGKTIGALFHHSHTAKILSICNTSLDSATRAVQFIGDGVPVARIQDLPGADVTLITTQDGQIQEACEALSLNAQLQADSVVLHCSGALTSDSLNAVKQKGCFVASIHPMRSFANPELSLTQYPGTFCAVEGDEDRLIMLESLFNAIGSITYRISKDKKTLYHIAGVVASNYLVTLACQAKQYLEEAGVPGQISKDIVSNLMQGAVSNLAQAPVLQQALTGPVKRNDIATLERHLNAISNQEQHQLYCMLGKATVPLTTLKQHEQDGLLELFTI